jgi:hypothetical protein
MGMASWGGVRALVSVMGRPISKSSRRCAYPRPIREAAQSSRFDMRGQEDSGAVPRGFGPVAQVSPAHRRPTLLIDKHTVYLLDCQPGPRTTSIAIEVRGCVADQFLKRHEAPQNLCHRRRIGRSLPQPARAHVGARGGPVVGSTVGNALQRMVGSFTGLSFPYGGRVAEAMTAAAARRQNGRAGG